MPWQKDRACLLQEGTVEQRVLEIPQSQLIREYYRSVNRVDIHNQYRQGIWAIEKTWKTRSWNLRLFQTVIGKILVNALFTFRFVNGNTPSLHDFTNLVAQALCDEDDEESDYHERGRSDKGQDTGQFFAKCSGTARRQNFLCSRERRKSRIGQQTQSGAMPHMQGQTCDRGLRYLL